MLYPISTKYFRIGMFQFRRTEAVKFTVDSRARMAVFTAAYYCITVGVVAG
jgi:hypothetical protein